MTDRSSSSPGERSTLDQLLDVALYGPVGLALSARQSLPKWAEEGRRQLGGQLNMAKVIGRLAVGQASRQAEGVLRGLAREAEGVLAALGLVPQDDDDLDHDEQGSPGATATDHPPAPPAANGNGVDPDTPSANGSRERRAAGGGTGRDAADLPIPGYDTLSASQIVQRLPGLSAEELEAVRVYELAGRARKTVLLRVAQLKASP